MMNYKHYHRDEDYNKRESTFSNIFQKRFNLIKKYYPSGNNKKVLDIGCSNGVFLDIFKKNKFITWGIEPSEIAKIATSKGHKIIYSDFEKAKLPTNYFDVVVMNHVLEHLENSQKILIKIKEVLKKGGMVLIDVPNVGSLLSKILGSRWPYLVPDEHLWQFDKNSLTKIVKDAGFKIIYWESRSGIFEYANPLKEIKRRSFIKDIVFSPFTALSTLLNMGDSMSILAKK